MRGHLCFVLIVLFSISLHAQTAAQRALMNEPEVRQINAMTRNLQQQQDDPDSRGSWINMAGLSLIDLRTAQALLDRLEDRLNTEARACGFCAAKQDELSELIRERVALQNMTARILGPGSQSVQQLVGVVPEKSRWSDIRIGLEDGAGALRAYCAPLKNQDDACKGEDAAMRLAGGHENAWANCFNAHNWVQNSSERKAYESCLADKDPIAKLCAHARVVSPQTPACPSFTVRYSDVDQLRFHHDRFSTDPAQLPATATIVTDQPARFVLLEPLIAPAMPTYPGFTTKVRARLDTALVGEYAPGLNPSTTNVSVLDPKASVGLSGRVILIPAGTEFQVDVVFNGPNRQKGDGGRLNLQIVNLQSGPNMLSTQGVTRTIPWPEAGTVLMPANSGITLATQCGCPYVMSVADFRKRAAEYTAFKATAPASKYRVIVMGTRIEAVLLEPIVATDVQQSDKRFHAQLGADSVLPAVRRDDAMTLPKGTDVYLKITDQNGKPYLGQTATQSAWIRVDYVIVNGQRVVLNTVGAPITGVGPLAPVPGRGRAGQAVRVVQPAGSRTMFTVAEQAELNLDAAATSSAQPAPVSGPPVQPAPPAGTAKSPAAATPAPTTAQPRAQPGADTQKPTQQRAAECRSQALRDHPQGGAEFVQEYTSCMQAK